MYRYQCIGLVCLVLLCSVASSITDTDVIARTFSVSEVEPSNVVHSEVLSLSNEDSQRWANENETLVIENVQLTHPLAGGINYRVANAFVGTVFKAYSNHYPLELSVEDIWVAIAQGEVTYGIDFSDFNEAITQTDFILNDNGNKITMKLIAGFLGIGQNPKTNALRPILGWLTALPLAKPPIRKTWDEM
ncbi:unnamed protein product [Rotaria sp. Silwood1]|nr:unnamed protein product [Rotaria sp. Silwood1]